MKFTSYVVCPRCGETVFGFTEKSYVEIETIFMHDCKEYDNLCLFTEYREENFTDKAKNEIREKGLMEADIDWDDKCIMSCKILHPWDNDNWQERWQNSEVGENDVWGSEVILHGFNIFVKGE